MLDFVKRVAIGVAIAMCVFFLKSQVFALTVEGRYRYNDNSTAVDGSYVSAGSLISFTTPNNNHEFNFTRFFVRFSDTSFRADGTYRFEYNYNSPLINQCPNSYSISEGVTIKNVSCSYSNPLTTIVMTVTFDSAMSTVTLGSIYNYPLTKNTTYNFRLLTDYIITDIDSTYEAITNNTTVISNAMDGISSLVDYQTLVIETIRDFVHDFTYATIGDESANITSRSYSGTNTSGLGQNDTAGGSGLGSGGSGGYGFNFNDFTAPFAFVFARVEDFLNLNAMFLTYLINIITLGFIGLVLNR